jgi:uncharacterized membrane protein
MSATELPGTPPETMDEGLRLVLPGRSLAAGAGWDWVASGWRLFARAPIMWIISIVLLFIIAVALNFVPILGGLVFQLFQALFAAGFVAGCRSLERGGEFELEHLFAGFSKRFANLLVLGALVLLAWIAIFLVFAVFVGFSILGAVLTGDPEAVMHTIAASVGMLLLGLLVVLGLMVPLLAAYWFAPALVLIHDMAPLAALKASFSASFRNVMPFLVYSLVMLVAGIVAMIPFGLGLLVFFPVMIASGYASYRQVFTEDTLPVAPEGAVAG